MNTKEMKPLDFCNASSKFLNLVMENCLLGFEIGMSLWKNNVEFLINRINQWMAVHREYNGIITSPYGAPFKVINLSESFIATRDTIDFVQKTAKRKL